MRIATAELFELTLPLVEPFIISGGAITERHSLVVVLDDGAGHVGYGESPPFELPFYSEETPPGVSDLVRRGRVPRGACQTMRPPRAVVASRRDVVQV